MCHFKGIRLKSPDKNRCVAAEIFPGYADGFHLRFFLYGRFGTAVVVIQRRGVYAAVSRTAFPGLFASRKGSGTGQSGLKGSISAGRAAEWCLQSCCWVEFENFFYRDPVRKRKSKRKGEKAFQM